MNNILNVKMPLRKETNPQSVVRKNIRKNTETSIEKILDRRFESCFAILPRYTQNY